MKWAKDYCIGFGEIVQRHVSDEIAARAASLGIPRIEVSDEKFPGVPILIVGDGEPYLVKNLPAGI